MLDPLFLRELARPTDERVPREHRLAVEISQSDWDSLANHYTATQTWPRQPERIAGDLRRLFPEFDDEGYDLVRFYWGDDIPADTPQDQLIIDLMERAWANGWKPPPRIAHLLECLRTKAEWEERWRYYMTPRERAAERNWKPPPELLAITLEERHERIWGDDDMTKVVVMPPKQKEHVVNFVCDVKGRIDPRVTENVELFLLLNECDLRWNAWLECPEVRGFKSPTAPPNVVDYFYPNWAKLDDSVIAKFLATAAETHLGYYPAPEFLRTVLNDRSHQNTVDPVLEYLQDCKDQWDGTPRLATWLCEACGVEDTPYHRAVAEYVIKCIAYRARRPGCAVHSILVLLSKQGIQKSQLCKRLAIDPAWFTDTVRLADESKELVLSLAGVLVAEIAELGGSKRDVNEQKAMLSRTVDRGRVAYGHYVTDRKRRNIFIATGNEDTPLPDATGNKRYLPVRLECEIDLDWVDENLQQLLGEAAWMESQDIPLDLPHDILPTVLEHQEAARTMYHFENVLRHVFGVEPDDSFVMSVHLGSFLEHTVRERVTPQQIGAAMKLLGFVSGTQRVNGKVERGWKRGEGGPVWKLVADGTEFQRPLLVGSSPLQPPPMPPVTER